MKREASRMLRKVVRDVENTGYRTGRRKIWRQVKNTFKKGKSRDNIISTKEPNEIQKDNQKRSKKEKGPGLETDRFNRSSIPSRKVLQAKQGLKKKEDKMHDKTKKGKQRRQ